MLGCGAWWQHLCGPVHLRRNGPPSRGFGTGGACWVGDPRGMLCAWTSLCHGSLLQGGYCTNSEWTVYPRRSLGLSSTALSPGGPTRECAPKATLCSLPRYEVGLQPTHRCYSAFVRLLEARAASPELGLVSSSTRFYLSQTTRKWQVTWWQGRGSSCPRARGQPPPSRRARRVLRVHAARLGPACMPGRQ